MEYERPRRPRAPLIRWVQIARSYWCRDCDAAPGSPCITRNGKTKPDVHQARVDVVARCARCRTWMHADWEHLICERCAVLLRIET